MPGCFDDFSYAGGNNYFTTMMTAALINLRIPNKTGAVMSDTPAPGPVGKRQARSRPDSLLSRKSFNRTYLAVV